MTTPDAQRKRWRLLSRASFALLLGGCGWALHAWLPPVPRWVIEVPPTTFLPLKADLLVSLGLGDSHNTGPVQLWDLATGRPTAQFLTDVAQIEGLERTPDGRVYFALGASGKSGTWRIHRIDLIARRQSHIETRLGEVTWANFAPGCEFMDAQDTSAGGGTCRHRIVETATGRVVGKLEVVPPWEERSRVLVPFHPNGEFSRDGSWFVAPDRRDAEQHTHILNTRTGKTTVLENVKAHAQTPDSRALIADCGDDGAWVLDLATMQWRCRLDGTLLDHVDFSPDGRFAAFGPSGGTDGAVLTICDLQTGNKYWEVRSVSRRRVAFSPDSRWLGINVEPTRGVPAKFSLYELGTRQLAWSRDFLHDPEFTPDSRWLAGAETELDRAAIIDVASGETRHTFATQAKNVQTDLLADGRALVVAELSMPREATWWTELCDWLLPYRPRGASFSEWMLVHVYDIETGQQLGRVSTAYAPDLAVSSDCSCLLMVRNLFEDRAGGQRVQTQTIVECWDLPPRKAWTWIVGTPLGVGVIVMAGRAYWRRRKRPLSHPAADTARLARS